MPKQVVQSPRGGPAELRDVPDAIAHNNVIVAMVASAISAGTERYVIDLASKSLISKARARPDHVRRVLHKIRTEGFRSTLEQLRSKLNEPMALGYSGAGIVIECGRAIRHVRPGDRVAVAAPHAGVVAVGANLCARIPANVSFEDAAFTSISSIALQGIRLAKVGLGERVLVIGTGLIGLITIALLRSSGCNVMGLDVDDRWFKLAGDFGAEFAAKGTPADLVRTFTRGLGLDAAIITTATDSNEPIEFAAQMCRERGRIVLVGVAGTTIPRQPFFEKELEFSVSHSMGVGRGNLAYESGQMDYPIGHARWTVQRNMEAVLEQMAAGRLPVNALVTHRFPIEHAPQAYALLQQRNEPYLGVVLEYADTALGETAPVGHVPRPKQVGTGVGVGFVGAGNFAKLVTIPLLRKIDGLHFRGVCTTQPLGAALARHANDFAYATTDPAAILGDADTDAVFVLTRHEQHGDLVSAALMAGKHVFVEKPLCTSLTQLRAIDDAQSTRPDLIVMPSFNRRFAPFVLAAKAHLDTADPLSISYRFAVGEIPESSWLQDLDTGGGRLVGEACHAIDACIFLTGSPVTQVFAQCVGPEGSVRTPDDRTHVLLKHANGSSSTVSYQAGGDSSGPKERFEVFGGGRTVVMEDWRHLTLRRNGAVRTIKSRPDRGHMSALTAFIRACSVGGPSPIPWRDALSATWASLAAVESLRTGLPVLFERASDLKLEEATSLDGQGR